MQSCAQCGGAITRTKKEQARLVLGSTFLVRAPAFACRSCRAVFTPGEILTRVDLEVATVLAMRGLVNGESLRFMRKALGLRAFELAALLDVTAETMSRWEHDQRGVDLSAWIVVGGVVLERAGRPTETLRRLLATKKPVKLPKTIKLSLGERKAPAKSKSKSKVARVA